MGPSIRSSMYRRVEQHFAIGVCWSSLTLGLVQVHRLTVAHCIVPPCTVTPGRRWRTQAHETHHSKEHVMRSKHIYFLGLTAFALNFIPSSRAEDSPDHKALSWHRQPQQPACAPNS